MSVEEPEIQRINFLKAPIDILPEESIDAVFKKMSEDGKQHQVVLVNLFSIMKARRSKEFMKTLQSASLVLPTDRSIMSGIRFLKKKEPIRYRPFDFVIKILGTMEKYNKTLYLLGGKQHRLQLIFQNMKTSFPKLTIVGRYTGYYPEHVEDDILLAIKKAAPALLLAGDGLKGGDKWLFLHKEKFNPGIYIHCSECYAIFSGKKKKGSKKSWENGTEVVGEVLKNPLKILRIVIRIQYLFVLLFYRLFRR